MNGVFLTLLGLSLLMSGKLASADDAASVAHNLDETRPSLVVMIAIDQLRRDRLTGSFKGGLGRLFKEGRVFTEATLDHGITNTCPGHSVMLTGMNPGKAGIPGNTYVNKDSWETRYCVDDDDAAYQVIGRDINRSPRSLLVPTLGDWLKKENSENKVFSVGGKDRATITMAGHKADGVYWFDSTLVRFTTSAYYEKSLPDDISAFNGIDPLKDGFLSRLPDEWRHEEGDLRPDQFEGEDDKLKNTSGHPLKSGDPGEMGKRIYQSPYVDTASIELARAIVLSEKLGQRGRTDLLAIALSATDTVGHLYGPFSAESQDTLRNIDEKLGQFLGFLDKTVGEGQYVVVLTADHGVAELPEWAQQNGRLQCPAESGRAGVYGFIFRLYWYVYSRFTRPFGDPEQLVKFADAQISVNRRYADELGLDPAEVLAGVAHMLEAEDVIKKTWTMKEMQESEDEIAGLFRRSYVPGKSGDLFIQLEPTCLVRDSGTTHGSPYHYDRDIPLVFYGPGIEAGSTPGEAHSVDIATTLARLLRIKHPPNLDGKILKLN